MATLDSGDSEGENPNGGDGGCSTGAQGGDLVRAPEDCLVSSHGFVGPQARASDLFGNQGGERTLVKAGETVSSQGVGGSGRVSAWEIGSFWWLSVSDKDDASKTDSPWLKKSLAGSSEPVIEVVGGVASMKIPEDIFDKSEMLWKSFVVGYFIGVAPHILAQCTPL
ncbi:DUF4283 domain-containing protein [Raphanus sativus]|nr:DUF4283 domain-containing protein [Raphanus sativus]